MATIMPQGDALRKAVQWYSEKRKDNPDTPASKLLHEASVLFNLSPADAEALRNYTKESG